MLLSPKHTLVVSADYAFLYINFLLCNFSNFCVIFSFLCVVFPS